MSTWNKEHTVEIYSHGIIHCSVCAPKEMPCEELEKIVNEINPTDIDSPWERSTAAEFKEGTPNGCPCLETTNRCHWLMVC